MRQPVRGQGPLIITILVLVGLLVSAGGYMVGSQAQGSNHASLVVVFGTNDVFNSCVSFSEPEISGVDLLKRAGLTLLSQQVAGVGESVCKIEEVGCNYPGEACFCKCLGSPCSYWSYWTWNAGEWIYSGRGASQTMVQPGSIQAWVWGDGQTQPPVVGPQGVCGGGGLQQAATETPVQPTDAGGYNPYPEQTLANSTATYAPAETPIPSLTPQSYPAATGSAPTATAGTSAPSSTPAQAVTAASAAASPSSTIPPATAAALATRTLQALTATTRPDRSASVVARAATNAALTGVPPVTPGAIERRSYWAFLGIALLLAALIGYVLLVRRQRARRKPE
ncbi:MAG: hypothetical protein ACYC6L_08305 [Anaerolineae bacterium]